MDYEITDDAKREVLANTDLVSLIGGTTSLKKMGASWKGLCPFHTEKTPSFHVHPEKGFYYCFGCGAKGDAITFVRETERLEYPEAVAYLARLAGVRLPPRRSGGRAERSRDTGTAEALAAAAAFFRAQLARHEGAKALLERRGLSLEEAALYGFGAAPESWDALKTALARFTEDALVEAGLLQRHPDTGRVYDRFRNRLTVEIRDSRGEVLGFGARSLGDEQPKYLNSPESSRFSKGKLLYGLDRAKEAVRRGERIVLCEGYFDRIAFERAGHPEAVASMGTALTAAQADLLVRQAHTVIVAYDADEAGQAATKKAFALLLERNADVRQLVIPGEKDPDALLAAEGPEALVAALEGAPGVVAALAAGIPQRGSDPAARAASLNEAVAILRTAADPVLRHELLESFARTAGVPLATLVPTAAGKKTPRQPVEDDRRQIPEGPSGGEERVLSILLAEWPESAPFARRIPPEIFMHPVTRELFLTLRTLAPEAQALDFSSLASHVGADAGQLAARLLLLDREKVTPGQTEDQGSTGLGRLHKPLIQLNIRHLEERGRALQREIELEDAGAPDGQELRKEKQRLAAEIHRLRRELRGAEGA